MIIFYHRAKLKKNADYIIKNYWRNLGTQINGLLYELDYNGVLGYYQYYEDGFENGEYVTFCDTGAVSSYCIMKGFSFIGKLYEWYKNGNLKCYCEKDSNQRYIKTIEFDENGKITLLIGNT